MSSANLDEVRSMVKRAVSESVPLMRRDRGLFEVANIVREKIYVEDKFAPEYRAYLASLKNSVPRRDSRMCYLGYKKGVPSDIMELEMELVEWHELKFNPLSGFLCHLAGMSADEYGNRVDHILDPGGP